MRHDRLAFAVGVLALTLAAIAFLDAFGRLDGRSAGFIAPAAMVIAGVGVLLLSRRHN